MGFKQNKSFLVLLLLSVLSQALFVNCQDEDETQDTTTQAPDEDTTTESGFETTTPVPAIVLENLDYQFSSLVGGFTVDVNFTQLSDNPNATYMSMLIASEPDSDFAKQICTGNIKLIAAEGSNCDGVVPGVQVNGNIIAHIDKASGTKTGEVQFSIPYFRGHNCLIVASIDPTTATTSTEATSTSTTTTPAGDESDSTSGGDENDTTESEDAIENNTEIATDAPDDADVQTSAAESRVKRQLTPQLGNANLGDGDIQVEKHQYDVKKIANQVDTDGSEVSETDNFVDQPEEVAANLDEYYDPEDIDNSSASNVLEVSDVGVETAEVDDDQADAERLGLDVEELAVFRQTGCSNSKIANKIELFTPMSLRQTRGLIQIGAVFSVGSVPSTVTVVSSGATTIINFGSAGSFTFNPLANWPLVVLQGSAVLATYGVIIVWALILGAIVWSVSVGQFSGFFSAKRVGYVASELIYGPMERLSTMVHNGIERFSDLNRRNSFNNHYGHHNNNRRKPNQYSYQHRSSYAYDEEPAAAADDTSGYDYKFENDYN